MSYTQADLRLAQRHVAQGERHVTRQEQLITRLRLRALPTEAAEALLVQFNDLLHQHRTHLVQIEADLEAGLATPRSARD